MIWAATTDLVMLAMANWSSTRRSRASSALPTTPLQVPSAVITVAVIPPPSPISSLAAASSKAAWNCAASTSVTGSSLTAANAAVGKAVGCSVGSAVGDAATADSAAAIDSVLLDAATDDSDDGLASVAAGTGAHAASTTTTASGTSPRRCLLIPALPPILSASVRRPSWRLELERVEDGHRCLNDVLELRAMSRDRD